MSQKVVRRGAERDPEGNGREEMGMQKLTAGLWERRSRPFSRQSDDGKAHCCLFTACLFAACLFTRRLFTTSQLTMLFFTDGEEGPLNRASAIDVVELFHFKALLYR